MEKDTFKTDVIFRVDKFGVYAIFPHNVDTLDGRVTIYAHVGQHTSGDYKSCIAQSRLATEAEAKDLKNELENSVGYDLNVIKKQNYNKYLKSYHEARKL